MKNIYPLIKGSIEIMEGDITELNVDAIVNAANSRLILGGGVAGAIRLKGGPSIQEECNKHGSTFVGGAVLTGGGNLPAKFVIHAVGPQMGEGDEDEKLKNAIQNVLKIATREKLGVIAFPAISTGIFGFPVERCARIMSQEVIRYLPRHGFPEKVIFCLWGMENYRIFKNIMDIAAQNAGGAEQSSA